MTNVLHMTTAAQQQAAAQAILAADWLSTGDLIHMATSWYTYPATPYSSTDLIAEVIVAGSVEEAAAYYASLPEEQQREEAAEALAAGGWDMTKIAFKRS